MIQDIAPHTLNNSFKPGQMPKADDFCFCFRGREVMVSKEGEELRFPKVGQLSGNITLQWLFSIDGKNVFLEPGTALAPAGFEYANVRSLRGREPRYMVFAAWTAFHLSMWYSSNKYCGSCGHETVSAPDERALDCPFCTRRIYPRVQPAVIVGVTNGDSLLMTHYADRPLAMWALVAGFNEIGETLEETVAREVMEETGLKVKNIRYYKSQPWGIVGDILAGYYCDVDGDPTVHVDNVELREGVWTPRAQIEGQPDDFSLTNEMMMVFKAGREPK